MMQIRLRLGRLLPVIAKVIAFLGIPRNPCPRGHFPIHEIENIRMKCTVASFCPDVCAVPS